MMEVKWVRPKSRTEADILNDIGKMMQARSETTHEPPQPLLYQMVVGVQPELVRHCSKQSEQLGEQLRMALSDDQDQGLWGATAGGPKTAVLVVVLREQPWWADIAFSTENIASSTENPDC